MKASPAAQASHFAVRSRNAGRILVSHGIVCDSTDECLILAQHAQQLLKLFRCCTRSSAVLCCLNTQAIAFRGNPQTQPLTAFSLITHNESHRTESHSICRILVALTITTVPCCFSIAVSGSWKGTSCYSCCIYVDQKKKKNSGNRSTDSYWMSYPRSLLGNQAYATAAARWTTHGRQA